MIDRERTLGDPRLPSECDPPRCLNAENELRLHADYLRSRPCFTVLYRIWSMPSWHQLAKHWLLSLSSHDLPHQKRVYRVQFIYSVISPAHPSIWRRPSSTSTTYKTNTALGHAYCEVSSWLTDMADGPNYPLEYRMKHYNTAKLQATRFSHIIQHQ
jgi:hypothetical protein